MKNNFSGIISDDLLISIVKLKLCLYFDIFKIAAILRSRKPFLQEVIPEVEYISKIALTISDILSIQSVL